MTASRMDELLSQFIMEARREDSEVYPPKTFVPNNCFFNNEKIAILDGSNPTFYITRKTLDAKMKALTRTT